jgi:hypothetical protein
MAKAKQVYENWLKSKGFNLNGGNAFSFAPAPKISLEEAKKAFEEAKSEHKSDTAAYNFYQANIEVAQAEADIGGITFGTEATQRQKRLELAEARRDANGWRVAQDDTNLQPIKDKAKEELSKAANKYDKIYAELYPAQAQATPVQAQAAQAQANATPFMSPLFPPFPSGAVQQQDVFGANLANQGDNVFGGVQPGAVPNPFVPNPFVPNQGGNVLGGAQPAAAQFGAAPQPANPWAAQLNAGANPPAPLAANNDRPKDKQEKKPAKVDESTPDEDKKVPAYGSAGQDTSAPAARSQDYGALKGALKGLFGKVSIAGACLFGIGALLLPFGGFGALLMGIGAVMIVGSVVKGAIKGAEQSSLSRAYEATPSPEKTQDKSPTLSRGHSVEKQVDTLLQKLGTLDGKNSKGSAYDPDSAAHVPATKTGRVRAFRDKFIKDNGLKGMTPYALKEFLEGVERKASAVGGYGIVNNLTDKGFQNALMGVAANVRNEMGLGEPVVAQHKAHHKKDGYQRINDNDNSESKIEPETKVDAPKKSKGELKFLDEDELSESVSEDDSRSTSSSSRKAEASKKPAEEAAKKEAGATQRDKESHVELESESESEPLLAPVFSADAHAAAKAANSGAGKRK